MKHMWVLFMCFNRIQGEDLAINCLIWFPSQVFLVMSGRIFLDRTSAQQRIECLAQRTQHSASGETRTSNPSITSQALYHWATALLIFDHWNQLSPRWIWLLSGLRRWFLFYFFSCSRCLCVFCTWCLFCNTVLDFLSSFANISPRQGKPATLL